MSAAPLLIASDADDIVLTGKVTELAAELLRARFERAGFDPARTAGEVSALPGQPPL
jgi:hypothetical protein